MGQLSNTVLISLLDIEILRKRETLALKTVKLSSQILWPKGKHWLASQGSQCQPCQCSIQALSLPPQSLSVLKQRCPAYSFAKNRCLLFCLSGLTGNQRMHFLLPECQWEKQTVSQCNMIVIQSCKKLGPCFHVRMILPCEHHSEKNPLPDISGTVLVSCGLMFQRRLRR